MRIPLGGLWRNMYSTVPDNYCTTRAPAADAVVHLARRQYAFCAPKTIKIVGAA